MLKGFGQLDGGKCGAALEGVVGDACQSGEVIQFCEGTETLTFEHVGDVGHLGCLTIGEDTVAIGIEGSYTESLDGGVGNGDFFLTVVLGLAAYDCLGILRVTVARTTNALRTGVEAGEKEVSVALTTPSPVDVVAVIAIITVANEGMAGITVGTREIDHAALLQLLVNQGVPIGVGIGTSIYVAH